MRKGPPAPLKMTDVNNPCTRNCCLDENDICVGCGRSLNEITAWHSMSPADRVRTMNRAGQRRQPAPNE